MAKKDKKTFLNIFFTLVKVSLIIAIACTLAGYAAIKMFLNNLEPIPNLANYFTK